MQIYETGVFRIKPVDLAYEDMDVISKYSNAAIPIRLEYWRGKCKQIDNLNTASEVVNNYLEGVRG